MEPITGWILAFFSESIETICKTKREEGACPGEIMGIPIIEVLINLK